MYNANHSKTRLTNNSSCYDELSISISENCRGPSCSILRTPSLDKSCAAYNWKFSPMKSNSLNSSTTKLSSSGSSQRKLNGFSTTEDDSRDSGHGQICCLVDDGQRCSRPAGNACYGKRIAKTVQQRKLKLTIDHSVRHIYICDFHKSVIQSVRSNKKKKRGSDEDGGISPDHDLDVPEVDLFHLQVNTLRRYKRHYKIQTKPGLNKAQLADMVARHFRTIPVREKEALTYFIYMVKNNKSRFDQKHDHS